MCYVQVNMTIEFNIINGKKKKKKIDNMSIYFKVKLVIENFLSYEIREPCFGDIHV